jgi:hypothetical protein
MWRVNITCSGEAWKRSGADFKTMLNKYPAEMIASKKLPDETRIMAYKIEDVSEAEAFQEECGNFPGFTSNFESL